MQLELEQIRVEYAGRCAIEALSLTVPDCTIGCLLGPSGSGKSTLLRAIAGFVPVRAGHIRVNGELLSTANRCQPPEKRGVGMVFQDLALMPHLSIADNIAFGLFRWRAGDRRERTEELLELIGLRREASRFPHQISGGQRQRVAVARALAPRPRVLLLDEPFSSLDSSLRMELAAQIRELLKATGTTALMVTHDQHEAFAMGELVGVLNQGHLEQWDSAFRLYHEPASRFVARFVGEGVLIRGSLRSDGRVDTELGALRPSHKAACAALPSGSPMELLLRPDDIAHDDDSPLRAVIVQKSFRGAQTLYRLELPSGQAVLALLPSHDDLPLGSKIGIRTQLEHCIVFPAP